MKRRYWTTGELAYLREHAHEPAAVVAKALGREVKSVWNARKQYGLARNYRGRDSKLPAFVQRKHKEGWSDGEIAEAWGCERHAVGNIRRRLVLPSNKGSEHHRDRIREQTRKQLEAEGVGSLGELRVLTFRRRAMAAGWPDNLRPRAVQMLNALWERGPMTRREIAEAIGMPWKGSRKSLVSNDPEGSYLAHLVKRGLVIVMPRKRRVVGQGKGRSQHIYSLPLHIERGPITEIKSHGKPTRKATARPAVDGRPA